MGQTPASDPPAPGDHAGRGPGRRASARFVLGAARRLAERPDLWAVTVRQVRRLARPGWWRRPPFLPVPAAPYLAFRLQTQYGGDGRLPATADPDDVVSYLAWCRDVPLGRPAPAARRRPPVAAR